MTSFRRTITAAACAGGVGLILFCTLRWVPVFVLRMSHTPQPPITISRVFSIPADANQQLPLPPIQGHDLSASVMNFMSSDEVNLRLRVYGSSPTFSSSSAWSSDAIIGDTNARRRLLGIANETAIEQAMGQQLVRLNLDAQTTQLPYIKVIIPTEMNITQNSVVIAELNPLKSTITSEMTTSPRLLAVASAFDISGPARPDQLTWSWDVLAKAVGSRRSLTLQFPESAKFDFKFENQFGDNVIVKGNTVTANVEIRDEFGLTQIQRSTSIALGAIIGTLGTILGFPFIKGRLEPKANPTPSFPKHTSSMAVPQKRRNKQH